jgi:hypothetical protein
MTGSNPVAWLAVLVVAAAPAMADERRVQISGTITTTLTIFEDAELSGDVTCEVEGAPCLAFGAPDITLRLKGFRINGRAEPPTGCVSIADFFNKVEDGISIVGQNGVAVLGPGRIENFARYGIFVMSSSTVTVRRVTAADNCFSGIQVWTVSDSELVENVSARNAMGSEAFPCGGI